MNIVKIRELAKTMEKAGALPKACLHKLLHAPVFLYTEMAPWTDDEIRWAEDNIVGGDDRIVPVNMPYKSFILVCEKTDKSDTETNTSIYFVFGGDMIVNTQNGDVKCILYIIEAQRDDEDGNDYWIAAGYTGRIKNGVTVNMYLNGKSHPVLPHKEQTVSRTASAMRSVVTRLCFDVMSKTSAVVRVMPKPRPDKGVEWHLSRTHYCIITKKQAMKIRDAKGAIDHHTIKRAAGWRRAHWRLLRSEKFTHKRGQKVPVIECWVGPDTWFGLDNKIYKVML